MNPLIHDDKTFNEVNYSGQVIRGTEFNNCVFKKCDLSDGEFTLCKFIDCVFEDCNLSMIKWGRSTLHDTTFKRCKLLGVNFSLCEDFLFSPGFEGCMLDYASFMSKKMPKTTFTGCYLKEVTFTQAILTGSAFNECDLNGTVFSGTDLTSVNFSTAFNFIIDPELNKLSKAVFATAGLQGLLYKYNIKVV